MVKATIVYKDSLQEKIKFKSFAEYSAFVDKNLDIIESSKAQRIEDVCPKEGSSHV